MGKKDKERKDAVKTAFRMGAAVKKGDKEKLARLADKAKKKGWY